MNSEYSEKIERLEVLAREFKNEIDALNEATTRLRYINKLFSECLDWDTSDIIAEEYEDGTYTDYVFFSPNKVLVVEAKREGDYFDVPIGYAGLIYKINYLIRGNNNLKAALEQVTDYCNRKGVPFGAICNGHQIVAFIPTRIDGVAPLEGNALVFPSIEYMLENFTDFWNALSKKGIQAKTLATILVGRKLITLPAKLSSKIDNYPRYKDRNPFQNDLMIVSDLVIEDITKHRELERLFLEECYCESGALSQYSTASKTILQSRYAALFENGVAVPEAIPATTKEGITDELFPGTVAKRPLILIGDVGVGKTTFINHLIKVAAPEEFERAITFYIDFGSQGALASDLKTFVIDEIVKQLRENFDKDIEERDFVRGVYHGELLRFGRSYFSDLKKIDPESFLVKEIEFINTKILNKIEHVKACLEHLSKGESKQIVMFLDNSDQREEKDQEKVFLIAQELAEHWPTVVYVSLRPGTFSRSTKAGTLTGYHTKVFTIPPPRVDEVIDKRLNFALKITTGEIPLGFMDKGVVIHLENLQNLIKVFIDSLEKNYDLQESIDNISGGNIRLALDLVKRFFGSGHVDTEKIVDIYRDTGFYLIPLHEFLRAITYGDYREFHPSNPAIVNLFDVSSLDRREHFLLPLIIGTLFEFANSGEDEGFMETTNIYEITQGLGFSPEQIDFALVRAIDNNVIETTGRVIAPFTEVKPKTLRITPMGIYHILKLCRLFTYMDAIIVDTPIFAPEVRLRIKVEEDIMPRLERAIIFCSYLDDLWLNNFDTYGRLPFNWSECSSDLKTDIEKVRRKAEEQRTRF